MAGSPLAVLPHATPKGVPDPLTRRARRGWKYGVRSFSPAFGARKAPKSRSKPVSFLIHYPSAILTRGDGAGRTLVTGKPPSWTENEERCQASGGSSRR